MPDEEGTQVVNETAVVDTATTDSTTEENNSTQVADQTPVGRQTDSGEIVLETPEVTEDTDTSESSEDTDTTEADDVEEPPKRGAEARKEQLNTEIRDLVSERNAIRAEVERLNAQVYQPASVEELTEQVNPETGEYYNRLEAQIESMRQEREVEKYNNQVAETRFSLANEASKALQDFPMFDETSPEYNPQAAQAADRVLGQSLIRDPNVPEIDPSTGQPTGLGVVIGSHISPYQLYQSLAVSAQASAQKAKLQGQRNVEKMLSQTDTVTGGQGRSKTFEQMSLKEQEAWLRKRGHDI